MKRPAGMRLPDLTHLSPEHAELFEALYVERNRVSPSELVRVRRAAFTAQRVSNESHKCDSVG